jgi:hypothetical protein
VNVQAATNSSSKFLNYKHSFSAVLLALVDARYKFRVVDIGSLKETAMEEFLHTPHLGNI